ncbi:hypothetical protein FKM82_007284 [Ascaphus truei]
MNLLKGFLVLGVVTAVRSASLYSNHGIVESKAHVPESADSNTKGAYQGFPHVKDELKHLRTRRQLPEIEIASDTATGKPQSGHTGEAETGNPLTPKIPKERLKFMHVVLIDDKLPKNPNYP